jgi:transposase
MLLERKHRADAACREAADKLAVAALRASEAGASRKGIADGIGVGTSTVQGWIRRARQLEQPS